MSGSEQMQRNSALLILLIVGVALQAVIAERVERVEVEVGHQRRIKDSVSSKAGTSKAGAARSSRHTLATDAGISTEAHTEAASSSSSHSAAATSSFASLREAMGVKTQSIPGSAAKGVFKICAGCVCILVLMKLCGKIDCCTKRLDCRRIKCIGRFLIWSGWDEFPGTKCNVTLHSIADIQNKGVMGGEKLFKVKVAFKWSQFMSSSTADMKWEQTKGMEVPQGADECEITLLSEGKVKDTVIGTYVLETKRDMIDAKKFWGVKKKFKLENKGKLVGTVVVTFRNQDDWGTGGGSLPIEGVEEDSALAIAIRESYEEMIKTGVIKKPDPKPSAAAAAPADDEEGAPAAEEEEEVPKLQGNEKLDCLSRCITGNLREVNHKGKVDKDGGKVFIRVVHCNFAELQGDKMKDEMAKQWKKAQDKGLKELPKKWYWAWYEDKKAAFHEQRWHEPDGYIPMTAISKVNRQPERIDQFVISYVEDSEKKTMAYRREGGKSLDVWLDGVDLCFNECRTMVKEEKENEEKRKKGLA